jgi:hypothetical protein
MLRTMRAPDGGPALRTRLLAIMVIVGMLLLSGAEMLIPVFRWAVNQVWF